MGCTLYLEGFPSGFLHMCCGGCIKLLAVVDASNYVLWWMHQTTPILTSVCCSGVTEGVSVLWEGVGVYFKFRLLSTARSVWSLLFSYYTLGGGLDPI